MNQETKKHTEDNRRKIRLNTTPHLPNKHRRYVDGESYKWRNVSILRQMKHGTSFLVK